MSDRPIDPHRYRKIPDSHAQAIFSLEQKELLSSCVFGMKTGVYDHLYIAGRYVRSAQGETQYQRYEDMEKDDQAKLRQMIGISNNKVPLDVLMQPKVLEHVNLMKSTSRTITILRHSYEARKKCPSETPIARMYDDIKEGRAHKNVSGKHIRVECDSGSLMASTPSHERKSIIKQLFGPAYDAFAVVGNDNVTLTLTPKNLPMGDDANAAVNFDMDYGAAKVPEEQLKKLIYIAAKGRGIV